MAEEKEYISKVGKNIRKLRLDKKIRQLDLADACDFDKQTLYNIEMGKVNLTLKSLLKISKALNVSIKNLLDFD